MTANGGKLINSLTSEPPDDAPGFNTTPVQPLPVSPPRISLTRDMLGSGNVPGASENRIYGTTVVNDGTVDRILFGRLPDGTFGLVISKANIDVKTVFS